MNDVVKVALGFFGGVLALLVLFALFSGSSTFGAMPMMQGFGDGPGGMMGGGFGSWWMLLPILFWAGLLALIAWAVVRIFPANRTRDQHHDSAEDILRERFARGEIDRDEYGRGLETLREERSPRTGSHQR